MDMKEICRMKFMKRFLLILFIIFSSITNSDARWGYSFRTIDLFGGMSYYGYSPIYNIGINYDHFSKNCMHHRLYFGIQGEYNISHLPYYKDQSSIKFSKGFMFPYFFERVANLNPVVSLNISYFQFHDQKNLSARPEIGFVVNNNSYDALN